ncbi:hypothetical protein C8J56DRAFT_466950 [Mycena floridula]|nr:hypothetical protein C8J56DRAFT_466950 [Mycena floridula]
MPMALMSSLAPLQVIAQSTYQTLGSKTNSACGFSSRNDGQLDKTLREEAVYYSVGDPQFTCYAVTTFLRHSSSKNLSPSDRHCLRLLLSLQKRANEPFLSRSTLTLFP